MIVKYSCFNGTGLQVVKQEAGWRAELNTLKKSFPFTLFPLMLVDIWHTFTVVSMSFVFVMHKHLEQNKH